MRQALAKQIDFQINKIIDEHTDVICSLQKLNIDSIKELCKSVVDRIDKGGRIFFAGNGGSAASSQHLAAEFIGRFKTSRKALPAMALTTDSSVITAVANDFSFNEVIRRQVEALCCPGDVIIVISTSGNSENLIVAIEEAKQKNVLTAGLLGKDGGRLSSIVHIPIIVHNQDTARIQEAHVLIGHILCEYCDEYFAINY